MSIISDYVPPNDGSVAPGPGEAMGRGGGGCGTFIVHTN